MQFEATQLNGVKWTWKKGPGAELENDRSVC